MTRDQVSIPRGELFTVAVETAWRFRAYRGYGLSKTKACRAIRRRCPTFSKRRCENAFAKSLVLYDVVERVVSKNERRLWEAQESGDDSWPSFFDAELRGEFSAIRIGDLRWMVSMMFYYWYLR